MRMQEIRDKASQIGLQGISKLRKAELVHRIQEQEGNTPCFGADWRQECREMGCCWRSDCLNE